MRLAARRRQRLWLLAVAGTAFAVVAVASRFGIGISTDSVAYIAEARQLLGGEGLTLPAGVAEIYAAVDPARDVVPTAHFPPLYPLVIAATGLAHAGASSFRWLNALLLAATALTLAVMVERHTGSRWAASLAAGAVVLTPPVLRVHAMAWSEPLFLALGFSGLLALAGFLEHRRRWTLVAGSGALGLAWVTRYTGIAFVLTGLTVLVLVRRAGGHRPAAAFLLLAVAPMAVYLAVMASVDAAGAGFTPALGRPDRAELRAGVETLRDWFAPARSGSAWQRLAWAPVAVLLFLQLRRGWVTPSRPARARLPHLPALLGTFLIVYPAVVLASQIVFVEYVPLEERFVLPAFVAAVALVACIVARGFARRSRPLRQPVLAIVAVALAATAAAGTALVRSGTRDYPGFEAAGWRVSDGIREVTGLPRETRIYSNYPDAVYISTGRAARLLPRDRFPGDKAVPDRRVRLARLRDEVGRGEAVVVLFAHAHRERLPGARELGQLLGVAPRPGIADALVYGEAGTTVAAVSGG